MYFTRITALGLISVALAAAQSSSYSIRAFAGLPRNLGDGGAATSALLWSPRGVSIDNAGNLYIADSGNGRIRKVTPDGTITTIAGVSAGFSGDGGPAAGALLSFPTKVAVAPNGDLYVADSSNNRIRRITANGVISTVAGTGQAMFNGDTDTATTATLSSPRDLAIDTSGNIYIADTNNTRIRRLTTQGRLTTVAGSGLFGLQGDDGPATRAALAGPRGVAVDATGNVYIADSLNNRIRKVTTDGNITTVAGGNNPGFSGDGGQASFAQLNRPTSVAVDRNGNIFFADSLNNRVRRINPQGIITTIAGTSVNGFRGDNGPGTAAQLNSPEGVAVDAAGNVFIGDTENHRVRKVTPQGIITTVAGSDTGSGDNGPAVQARLFQPAGIALDASGNVYISDSNNHRVRVVSPAGNIQTVAGNGSAGYSGDNGIATSAQLFSPGGLAVDRSGALFIADTGNHVIRRVASGVITTVAGTGDFGKDGDAGPPTMARLFNPSAVAFDRQGNLYIADAGNNRIRIVSNGVIRTFAGEPSGLPGFAGDNGPAAAASFDYPIALAIDDAGNVYVSDYLNNRIRRIAANGGTITTYAGTGTAGAGGDGGLAAQAQFYLPAGLAFDSNRNLYVADLLNSRIRVIAANGVVRTIAGTGARADFGDGGPALAAALAGPRDLAVDAGGNVYFSDQDNQRVRKLSPSSINIRTVVNAASGVAGPIAPGEAITIYGPQLGDQISFDGFPAVVIYSSATQVNAIVPVDIAGRTLTQLRVQHPDFGSDIFTLTVRDAAPGLFSINGSGGGQGAIVNQDGTVNSTSNPAPRGSIIAIYGTGQGTLNNATVRIEGVQAEVLFAGQTAPGLYQVNARIPDTAFASSGAPVELTVGSFAAQPGITVAIR